MIDILFCLKFRENPWGGTGSDLSSGLKNSVWFLVELLRRHGIRAKLVQLRDNNAIDRALHLFRPRICVLESYWVTPEKLDVLMPLHPRVQFAVRDHSESAFFAAEGIAMQWTYGYLKRGVEVMCNSPRAVHDMQVLARSFGFDPEQVSYAPNWYLLPDEPPHHHGRDDDADDVVRVCCLGSIRPLKNHLTQAIASIKFASQLNRRLEFHINGSRVESNGLPILKNLRELFKHTHHAMLIEHPWMERMEGPPPTFLQVLRRMHYSLQVSLSETFSIVSADSVHEHVPLITSPQVPWLRASHTADPNDANSIFERLMEAKHHHYNPENMWLREQWHDLAYYTKMAAVSWLQRFR